jgi:hypothetical protein
MSARITLTRNHKEAARPEQPLCFLSSSSPEIARDLRAGLGYYQGDRHVLPL